MLTYTTAQRTPHLMSCVFAALAGSLGCQPGPVVRELTPGGRSVVGSWNEVFAEGRRIELQLPKGGAPLLHIGQVLKAKHGNLIIPDGRARRILVFDERGALMRELQGKGEQSLQLSVLGPIAFDDQENLLVFDPDGRWVIVLDGTDYHVLRRFQLSASAADFLVLRDGALVTYFPGDELVFKKFDDAGTQTAAAYRPENERLSIFHGRVQTGGVAEVAGELFGLHPTAFQLIHLSSDLKVTEVLRGADGDPWSPQPRDLPLELNPYDYQRPHEEWWDSFVHIGRPYALDDLLLVTLFASQGLAQSEEFANIYRLNGEVVAQGLRVPHDGQIIGASAGALYVLRNARLNDAESLDPLELYEYRLRGNLSN